MNDILVSIITPSFNSGKTIKRTIEQVLKQSYKNYEYIIVDGGSTDNTINIIESFIPEFNGRLRYVSEKDDGIYDAMNKGIKMAKGELVGIINSDDYYEEDCLKNVVKQYDPNKKYQILYGAIRIIDFEENELEIAFVNHRNMKNRMIFHPATFISKSIYDDFYYYDTKYKYSSDLDFMYKAIANDAISFCPIYHVLSNFRLGGVSFSRKAMEESNKINYKYRICSRKKYIAMYLKIIMQKLLRM